MKKLFDVEPNFLLHRNVLQAECLKQFPEAKAFVVTYLVKGIHHFNYHGISVILLHKDEIPKLSASLARENAIPLFIDNDIASKIIATGFSEMVDQ